MNRDIIKISYNKNRKYTVQFGSRVHCSLVHSIWSWWRHHPPRRQGLTQPRRKHPVSMGNETPRCSLNTPQKSRDDLGQAGAGKDTV